jgi:hypothetical protein
MSCSYNVYVKNKTNSSIVDTFSQENVNCTKNQTFTIDYNNSPLTFQCPIDIITQPIFDTGGKDTNLIYDGYCQYNNNRPETITIVFGVISCILFVLVIVLFIVLFITRKK